jgi:hypothetical protein
MAVGPVAFYAVSDAAHFLGLVGLLNSLRMAGHHEPLFVADCGLESWQRNLLEPHAELVSIEAPVAPHLLKPMLPLDRPSEVMTIVDADVLVLRPLAPLLQAAAAGRFVVFTDPVSHRFDDRWESLLDLPPLERRPYVNSGFLVLPPAAGRRVCEAVLNGQGRVEGLSLAATTRRPTDPFFYVDQDVWNAVLASLVPSAEIEILEAELAPHPPFAGVRLLDLKTARCAYTDGREPYLLHHVARKPWLAPTRSSVYSQLLGRFLLGDDLALSLDPRNVPLRFRSGVLALLDRLRAEGVGVVHQQRGRLGLRRRLGERRGTARGGA